MLCAHIHTGKNIKPNYDNIILKSKGPNTDQQFDFSTILMTNLLISWLQQLYVLLKTCDFKRTWFLNLVFLP